MFNFHIFKGFLIWTELGKFAKLGKLGRKIGQIWLIYQLSLSFKKTQIRRRCANFQMGSVPILEIAVVRSRSLDVSSTMEISCTHF